MQPAPEWAALGLNCLPWCWCRPGPPLAGLISSLSDPKGRDPSQFRRAVTPPRPAPTTAILPEPEEHNRMPMLADIVDGVSDVDTHRETPPAAATTPNRRSHAQTA